MTAIVSIAFGYLLGSLSFSFYFVRRARGRDIRKLGSGNAGATNTLRVLGRPAALGVLSLDVAKGALPVAAAASAGQSELVLGLTGLAAVLGHIYPVFLAFSGGKGVATALGAMAYLMPWPTLLALPIFLAVVAWKRIVSLASISTLSAVPVLAILCDKLGWFSLESDWRLLAALSMTFLIVFKHSENIQRLRSGTERRFGDGASGGVAGDGPEGGDDA